MKKFKEKFEELGEMIEYGHTYGNDHVQREEQFKLFCELKVLVEKLNLPDIKVSVCECGLLADGTLYGKPMCEGCLHRNT